MTTVETLDARLSVGLYKHRKIKKLISRVGFEGPWRLVGLWLYARESRPNGVLHGMTAEDIELEVDWSGKAGALVSALLECRWLDKDGDTFVLHDWAEHQPFASNAQSRKDSARLAGLIRQYGDRKGREMFRVGQATGYQTASDALAECQRLASDPLADRSPPSFLPSSQPSNQPVETPRKRGSRLPKPLELSDEWKAEAQRVAPQVDHRKEFDKFCDHWWGKAGKDATKDDWLATWRNWVRRAAEFAPPKVVQAFNPSRPPKHRCIRCNAGTDGFTHKGNVYCVTCYALVTAEARGTEMVSELAAKKAVQ